MSNFLEMIKSIKKVSMLSGPVDKPIGAMGSFYIETKDHNTRIFLGYFLGAVNSKTKPFVCASTCDKKFNNWKVFSGPADTTTENIKKVLSIDFAIKRGSLEIIDGEMGGVGNQLYMGSMVPSFSIQIEGTQNYKVSDSISLSDYFNGSTVLIASYSKERYAASGLLPNIFSAEETNNFLANILFNKTGECGLFTYSKKALVKSISSEALGVFIYPCVSSIFGV